MLVPWNWNNVTGTTTQPYHENLENWIQKYYSSPHTTKLPDHCAWCQQPFSQELIFQEPTWIWFEVFLECMHATIPALKITLGSTPLQLTATIYYNGSHFRARLCDSSEGWWFYNGQLSGGQLSPLPEITDAKELFTCGDNYSLVALVYCLVDW